MTTNNKQYIPIFLSSTYKDMIPHRKEVLNTLDKLKVAVSGMEVFGARTEEPIETCLSEVEKCEVFIGILGMRYGSIDTKTGKSFVQREYETAMEKSLDIRIYLIDEEKALLHPKLIDFDESAKKLRDFKELLQNKHTVDFFSTPQDLALKVERNLKNLFEEKSLVIEKEKLKPSVRPEDTTSLLKKFDLMPKHFAGSEIELILNFLGPPKSVPKEICNAIKLQFGYSLSRPISILHPPQVLSKFTFLDTLYAEYGGCDFLYNATENKEFKIVARLAFGEERKIVWQPTPLFPSFSSILVNRPNIIKDLETGEPPFENYITHSPIKAIILVRIKG
jgi:hypothetical protein